MREQRSSGEYYHLANKPPPRFTAEQFRTLIQSRIERLWDQGHLQESFGYELDRYVHEGRLGTSLSAYLLEHAHIEVADPVCERIGQLSDAELFGVLEALHDIVSQGIDGEYNSFNEVWVFERFDRESARQAWRSTLNELLPKYGDSYWMGEDGRIVLRETGAERRLLSQQLPRESDDSLRERVAYAVAKFQKAGSSWLDRRAAVRELGDVLEFRRSEIRPLLRGHERQVFEILNRFGIRHHEPGQLMDYDEQIFLTWFFYHCLAGIHACEHLLAKRGMHSEAPNGGDGT